MAKYQTFPTQDLTNQSQDPLTQFFNQETPPQKDDELQLMDINFEEANEKDVLKEQKSTSKNEVQIPMDDSKDENELDSESFGQFTNFKEMSSVPQDRKTNSQTTPTKFSLRYILSLNYYEQYFDISTSQFLSKLKNACFPFRKEGCFSTLEPNTDLYGPVWISITLFVSLAIFVQFLFQIENTLQNKMEEIPAQYLNAQKLLFSVIIVYTDLFLNTILIRIFFMKFNFRSSFIHLIYIWEYGKVPCLALAISCIFPSHSIRLMCMLVILGICLIYYIKNYNHIAGESEVPTFFQKIIWIYLAASQIIFMISIKYKLFS